MGGVRIRLKSRVLKTSPFGVARFIPPSIICHTFTFHPRSFAFFYHLPHIYPVMVRIPRHPVGLLGCACARSWQTPASPPPSECASGEGGCCCCCSRASLHLRRRRSLRISGFTRQLALLSASFLSAVSLKAVKVKSKRISLPYLTLITSDVMFAGEYRKRRLNSTWGQINKNNSPTCLLIFVARGFRMTLTPLPYFTQLPFTTQTTLLLL